MALVLRRAPQQDAIEAMHRTRISVDFEYLRRNELGAELAALLRRKTPIVGLSGQDEQWHRPVVFDMNAAANSLRP